MASKEVFRRDMKETEEDRQTEGRKKKSTLAHKQTNKIQTFYSSDCVFPSFLSSLLEGGRKEGEGLP